MSFETDIETEAPPESALEDLREEIDALAARYELADGAADALQGFVRLIDWGEGNFVPKPERRGSDRRSPRAGSKRRVASTLAESLSGLELEPVRTARQLADIGSGAGFPGLVLAIALPKARVALIEKVPEKCSFLRRAAAELGLDNVEVVEGNVQQWPEGVGACDIVTSRKAARPNTIVEWSAPLLAPGGALLLWRGSKNRAKEALEAAADAAGLQLAQVQPVPLVNRKGKRVISQLFLYEKADES